MKAKKLLSIAIASLLLCGCIVGMLVTGASAAPGTYEVGEGKTYATVEAALAQIKTDAEAGTIDSAIITINGMANATVDADNIMFGVETIWLNKAEAKKLPITIIGTPNETVAPAEGVDINADGINFPADKTTGVFTNDYSFEGIKIHYLKSAASARVTFHAGSGAVTLKDVTMTTIGTNLGKSGYYLYADNNTAAAYKGWDGVQPVDGIINTSCFVLDGVTIPATSGKFNGVGAASGFAGEYATVDGVSVTAGQTQAKLVIQGNGLIGTQANVTYNAGNGTRVAKAILEINTNDTATAIPFIVGVSGTADTALDVNIPLEYNIKGGKIVAATFSSHGTDESRVINNAGNVTVNISGGTFEGNCSLTTAGTVTGTVTNNISGGTFMMKYAAGGAGEGCAKNIVNNISGGTFVSDTFFGNESTEATSVTTTLNEGTIALGNTTAITATAVNGTVIVKEIAEEDFIPTSVYVTVPTAGIASGATIKAAEDAAYGLLASVDGENTVWTAAEWSTIPVPTPPPAGEGGEGTGNEGGAGTGNEGNAGAGTGNEGGAGAGTGNEGGSNLGTGTSPTTSNNSMLFAWIALAVVSMTGVVVLRKRTSL